MSKFDTITGVRRENLLMETAMNIMDTYHDMLNREEISSEKWEAKLHWRIDSIALLQLFCDLAREFENTYYDTDEYNDDYISLVDAFATEKLKEEFRLSERF